MEQILVQINPDVPPTGSDLGITNAARKSFGRRSEWDCYKDGEIVPNKYAFSHRVSKTLKEKDKRLLEFLARGMTADDFEGFLESCTPKGLTKTIEDSGVEFGGSEVDVFIDNIWQWRNTPTHDTPFNHGFFSFEVKAPIFVARHLVKHEYLIMSEYSRRYITDDVEFYQHTYRSKADDVKQGSGGEIEDDMQGYLQAVSLEGAKASVARYNHMLEMGASPEQARGELPTNLMTSWTWSGTLGAFANMCKLRLSKDTQAETRYVAEQVYEELKKQFPVSAPLLVEGVY